MTEAEELLLCGLKFFPIRTGRLMLVMTLMNEEDKRWEMMRFLAKNLDASEDDILDEAYRIGCMSSENHDVILFYFHS